METIDRKKVIRLLTEDWANYVPRFQALPAEAKAAFLQKQGYKDLTGLLAHIVAWWELGMKAIRSFHDDPNARQPEIEMDPFNAKAVEKARGIPEGEEIRIFELRRQEFSRLIEGLTEEDLQDERVVTQIKWELVNHLEDHRID
jgi:hypothetical protein